MIDRAKLTKDLQKLLKDLEADLRVRCREDPASDSSLREEWRSAKEAGRTAQSFEMWLGGELVQIGAAWILGCVFLRFLEDNTLIEPPRLSGPGGLLRDFTDPTWSTRFLGDLYQDLSEAARKRFALLQTPDFVLDLILDRTLEPAVDTFGLSAVKVIDPTCGSGHFDACA